MHDLNENQKHKPSIEGNSAIKRGRSTTENSAYLVALRGVIDSLKPERQQVAVLLRVTPTSVSRWCMGDDVPSQENLYRLVAHLRNVKRGKSSKLDGAIDAFYEMASRPLVEVAGRLVKQFKGHRTVADYYLQPLVSSASLHASHLDACRKHEFWLETNAKAIQKNSSLTPLLPK